MCQIDSSYYGRINAGQSWCLVRKRRHVWNFNNNGLNCWTTIRPRFGRRIQRIIVMSFNSYAITPEMQNAMMQIADSRIATKSSKTIWYNPVAQQYFYANDPKSTKPDYGVPITKQGKLPGLDRSRFNQPSARQQLTGAGLESSTQVDKARYDIFTNETVDEAVMFYERMDRARKDYYQSGDEGRYLGAGTITSQ